MNGDDIIKNVNTELRLLPDNYYNRDVLILKTKYEDKLSLQKFEKISSIHKVDNFELIGTIIINLKKFNTMGCYDYFNDSNNFYDLESNEDYERFIQVLSYSSQNTKQTPIKEEKVAKTIDEIIDKYQLQSFKKDIEEFINLSDVKKGELLYNVKKSTKQSFVSFYNDFGLNKSMVSIRIKLYELSIEFSEFTNIIQTLKVGIISCFPKNDYSLRKSILENIKSGELKQDRNEINNFINQRKFTDREKALDTQLIKLKSFLNKKNYIKLSDNDQQRILNNFDKIQKIIEKKG